MGGFVSYVDSGLLTNEQVIYRTRLSRIIFVGPAILLALGLLFFLAAMETPPGGHWIAIIFIVPGLIAWLSRYIAYATSEFAITNKRVIVKVGLLRRRTLELQLVKLEAIAVDQGILGRIFRYGNIVVTGSGGTKEPFKRISDPIEFRRSAQAATG